MICGANPPPERGLKGRARKNAMPGRVKDG